MRFMLARWKIYWSYIMYFLQSIDFYVDKWFLLDYNFDKRMGVQNGIHSGRCYCGSCIRGFVIDVPTRRFSYSGRNEPPLLF